MKSLLAFMCCLLAVPSTSLWADPYDLIMNGHWREAADSLSRLADADTRDPYLLFCFGVLEKDGPRAAQLLEAALNASPAARLQEEIYFRLACYYFVVKDVDRLTRATEEYLTKWQKGRYRLPMLRFLTAADELAGRFTSAVAQIDKYLVASPRGDEAQWGEVDKARLLSADGKGIGAAATLKKLSEQKSGPGVSQALYLLVRESIERKSSDRAVLRYNLLRDEYPDAVGLDVLADKLSALPTASVEDTRAEALTSTYYSVKVGVFASEENARRLADSFRGDSPDIKTEKKDISGQRYHVVYVGRFKTYEAAGRLKSMLEARTGEAYQIVAR